ncbi:twin transmembrane helix small protein [Hyphomicrobium sulfonivorans]|uniref:twin transmembrane helix small protein n=1 Tax=Hyphomicrobium sulfonivorans TaxID=121290 RepID=UPI00156E7653|nr:twin transmembrane helix small protein [Hyphomicrobium sulfonivorans]MBI1648417.1 twin transmembrane helix small protein [Hyphomicrobium sulfonivorans]NSL71047.1 twin transmembrane helix small protein [Hyphomicrobium sulfonivorans]
METVLYHMTTIAVVAVAIVLFLGIMTIGQGRPNLSQKLMRWRVGLQALAIAIIVLYAVVHTYA